MSTIGDWLTGQFLNDDPRAGFYNRYKAGLSGGGGLANWLQNQYQNQYDTYKAGLPSHPNQLWTDYLRDAPDLTKQFSLLGARERGVDLGAFNPRIKYNPSKYSI